MYTNILWSIVVFHSWIRRWDVENLIQPFPFDFSKLYLRNTKFDFFLYIFIFFKIKLEVTTESKFPGWRYSRDKRAGVAPSEETFRRFNVFRHKTFVAYLHPLRRSVLFAQHAIPQRTFVFYTSTRKRERYERANREAAAEKSSLRPNGRGEQANRIRRDTMRRRIDRYICLGTHWGGEEASRDPGRDVSMRTFISAEGVEEGTVHAWIEIRDCALPRKLSIPSLSFRANLAGVFLSQPPRIYPARGTDRGAIEEISAEKALSARPCEINPSRSKSRSVTITRSTNRQLESGCIIHKRIWID